MVGWWASKQQVPKKRDRCGLFSTPAGVRTLDTLIKSQVLYQLSYGCMLFFEKRTSEMLFLELRVQRYSFLF